MGIIVVVLAIAAAACGAWALRLRALLARARAERTQALRRREEAEQATRSKSRFIAGLTHELRTPLTAVIGFSELLRDGRAGPVTSAQREQLGIVHSSAGHLLSLIDEVLDSAGIEAGHIRLDPQPVRPAAIGAECVAALSQMAAERGITLELATGEASAALLDPSRLRQVIVNFLSNAIKFTDAGGQVSLALTRTRGRLVIAVADTGIGIAPEDRERVFDEFVRIGGRDRAGSGLGLALTREIVRAQGGDVDVRSQPGVGSTFTAWLPWVEADTAPAHSESKWQAAVAALGLTDVEEPGGAPAWPRPPRQRRFRPRRERPAPAPADDASPSSSARAGRP